MDLLSHMTIVLICCALLFGFHMPSENVLPTICISFIYVATAKFCTKVQTHARISQVASHVSWNWAEADFLVQDLPWGMRGLDAWTTFQYLMLSCKHRIGVAGRWPRQSNLTEDAFQSWKSYLKENKTKFAQLIFLLYTHQGLSKACIGEWGQVLETTFMEGQERVVKWCLPASQPPERSEFPGPEVCSCVRALVRQGTLLKEGISPTIMTSWK